MNFSGDFGLRDTFQEQIAPKTIEIDMDKKAAHETFSILNVNFDGLSLDFLGSRKFAPKGIKEQYFRKSRYFIVVGQSFAPFSHKSKIARNGL